MFGCLLIERVMVCDRGGAGGTPAFLISSELFREGGSQRQSGPSDLRNLFIKNALRLVLQVPVHLMAGVKSSAFSI
jgi:hypothetical protein